MDTILGALLATIIVQAGFVASATTGLVSSVKLAKPDAPGWVYVLAAFGFAFVLALLFAGLAGVLDGVVTAAVVSNIILVAIFGALISMGLYKLNGAADTKRTDALEVQEYHERAATIYTPDPTVPALDPTSFHESGKGQSDASDLR